MKRLNGWFVSGLMLVVTVASAQEVKRPAPLPPLPPTIPAAQNRVTRPAQPVQAAQPSVVRPSIAAQVPTPPTAVASTPVQVVPPQSLPPTAFPPASPIVSAPGALTALKWDAEQKEATSTPGQMDVPFTFWLTNVSSADVSITSVRTSCGCTVAKLPSIPWLIPPGQSGPIDVSMNLAGKSGVITKAVTVETTAGVKSLLVKVTIPGAQGTAGAQSIMGDTERLKNMQLALADRQVLFKNQDCAKCHADPAKGHTDGRQIYAAVCSVCHDSHIRAAMVPDLKTLTHPTDAEHWRNWINYGRAGSMMPAFAQSEGGPLSEAQVDALVNYLVQAFPSRRLPGLLQQRASTLPVPTIVSPAVAVPAR